MSHKNPIVGICRYALVVVAALMVPLAVASPAVATPKGEFAVFAECPLSNATVEGCEVARTESGEITIGKKTVPIEKTMTLQGGLGREAPCEPPFTQPGECRQPFFEAAKGNTLTKVAQNVPGGLLGLVNCKTIENKGLREACELFFEYGITQVTATTELAAPAEPASLSPVETSPAALFDPVLSEVFGIPALKLPVKVKLDNPLFGNKCFIGSATEPIVLNLITGKTNPPAPNKPITGKIGEESSKAEGGIFVLSQNTLVDNSFSVPRVNGCGFFGLLDPIVDASLGVPSAAGKNTAILNNTIELAAASVVKASE